VRWMTWRALSGRPYGAEAEEERKQAEFAQIQAASKEAGGAVQKGTSHSICSTGARAKAWCLLVIAEASLSLSLSLALYIIPTSI